MTSLTEEQNLGGRPSAPRSDRVKQIRLKLGLTQEQFAKELNLSTYTLSKMEQQGREPGTQAGKQAFQQAVERAEASTKEGHEE